MNMKLFSAIWFGTVLPFAAGSSFPDTTSCDALDEAYGTTIMDWTKPAVRSDDYSVSANENECAAKQTSYVPEEYVSIHIRVFKHRAQYRGLLLYAVDSTETKVGSWELPYPASELFFMPAGQCGEAGKAVLHVTGAPKYYHHQFQFKAPSAGTGTIKFRVLLKRGEANLGEFYWPMQEDLQLSEATSKPVWWYQGSMGQSCDAVCAAKSLTCDTDWMTNGGNAPDATSTEIQRTTLCNLPLTTTCGTPGQDVDGWCAMPSASCTTAQDTARCTSSDPFISPLCACGNHGAPAAESECLGGSASGSSKTVVSNFATLLFSVVALLISPARSHNSGLVGVLLIGLLVINLPQTDAHNWVRSPSRSRGEASTLKPCRNRYNESNPHFQIGPDQTFEIEWATGHNHYFYFVVVHESDFESLKNITQKLLDQYVKEAPDGIDTAREPKWQKIHVNGGNEHLDVGIFDGKLNVTDPQYIKRHETMDNVRDVTLWKYREQYLQNDRRLSYENPNFPWIEAVHRFEMSAKSRPSDIDAARFTIEGRKGPGKYVVNYRWRGYYDCVDVDVFPEQVEKVYGRAPNEGDQIWQKIDHCIFEDIQSVSTSCAQVVKSTDACLEACKKSSRCGGVNMVPLWNPTTVNPALRDKVSIPWGMHRTCDPKNFNAPDGTMVCYGVRPRNPNNTHAEYTISLDPEDPLFYSTCYYKNAGWRFDLGLPTESDAGGNGNGNANATNVTAAGSGTITPWSFGGKCVSCEDRAKWKYSDDVPVWKLADECVRCPHDIPPPAPKMPPQEVAQGAKCDGKVGSDGSSTWIHSTDRDTCTARCHKKLSLINWNSMGLEDCVELAKNDRQCSDTVMFDGGCYCWSNAECCGECVVTDYNYADNSWNAKVLSTKAPMPDPTCSTGVSSSDKEHCCPASCVNSEGNAQCMPKPRFQISFQPAAISVPEGWLGDFGQVFAARNQSFDYGWNCDVSVDTKNTYSDDITRVYGTGIEANKRAQCTADAKWEVAVPDGDYRVELLVSTDGWGWVQTDGCKIEDIPVSVTAKGKTAVWSVNNKITVADGRLTLSADYNKRCRFLSGIRVMSQAAADSSNVVDECYALQGACCPHLVDMASRPCTKFGPPCKL